MPVELVGLLIVEDEEPLRLSLVRWAKSMGFPVLCFGSAEACLRAWRDRQFILESAAGEGFRVSHAVIDITLPGMDGLELAAQLSPPMAMERTIMITARVSEFPAGSRQYHQGRPILSKPFSLVALEDLIGCKVNDLSDR